MEQASVQPRLPFPPDLPHPPLQPFQPHLPNQQAYPSHMPALIALATFNSHIDAELARSALEAAGIDSMIAADDAGGQRPHMSFSQGVVVMVREEDAEAAREVLGMDRAREAGK